MYRTRDLFKNFLSILLCGLSLFTANALYAATEGDLSRYAASGELLAIEENKIIQIGDKKYYLDQNALVVDSAEKPVSIQQFKLPVHVIFEYSYHRQSDKIMAPVIVYLKQTEEARQGQRTVK